MRETAVVKIPSNPKYLCVVRSVTAVTGQICGMSDSETEDVKLAVDEACSNIIKHAYKGNTENKIVVKFRITQKAFEVILEDTGLKADPELIQGRDLDNVRPGGLGVHLIRRAFDICSFDKNRKKGNRLKLIRYMKGIKKKNGG